MTGIDPAYAEWYGWVGQRVSVKETLLGTLKYFGETGFRKGLWCGIELDNPVGKNDGMVQNVRYFVCGPNHGIFIPVSKVTKIIEPVNRENSCETNFNTREIQNGCNVVTPEIENSYACVNLTDVTVELAKEKLSSLRLASEESLGILDPDAIRDLERSFDSLTCDISVIDMAIVCLTSPKNCDSIEESVFLPSFPEVKENRGTINDQVYTSTPMHSTKTKISLSILEGSYLDNVDKETTLKEPCSSPDVIEFPSSSNSQIILNSDVTLNSPKFNSESLNICSRNVNEENLNLIPAVHNLGKSFIKKGLNGTYEIPQLSSSFEQSTKLTDSKKLNKSKMNNLEKPCQNVDLQNALLKNRGKITNFNATYEIKFDNAVERLSSDQISLATNFTTKNASNLCVPQNLITKQQDSISNDGTNQDPMLKTYVLERTFAYKELDDIETQNFTSIPCDSAENESSTTLKEPVALENSISLPDFSRTNKSPSREDVSCNETDNKFHEYSSSNKEHGIKIVEPTNKSLPLKNKKMSTVNFPNKNTVKTNFKPFRPDSGKQVCKISKPYAVHPKENGNRTFRGSSKENLNPVDFHSLNTKETRKTNTGITNKSKGLPKFSSKSRFPKLPTLTIENVCEKAIGGRESVMSDTITSFPKSNEKSKDQIKPGFQSRLGKTLPAEGFKTRVSNESFSSPVNRRNTSLRCSVGTSENQSKESCNASKKPNVLNADKSKSSGKTQILGVKVQNGSKKDLSFKLDKQKKTALSNEKLPVCIIKPNNSLGPKEEIYASSGSDCSVASDLLTNGKQSTNLQSIPETALSANATERSRLRPPKPVARNSMIPTLASMDQKIPRLKENIAHLKIRKVPGKLNANGSKS